MTTSLNKKQTTIDIKKLNKLSLKLDMIYLMNFIKCALLLFLFLFNL